ncbi:MAG: copper chaperone PCu(A)C [Anaerolineae bacterium]
MKKLLFVSLLVLLTAVACSGGGELVVTDAWGRPSPTAGANSAFYMTIENGTGQDDTLASVSAAGCGMSHLHESVMNDGVMSMQPVTGIPIPAGETVELKVGGLHVMCMNPSATFAVGDEVSLTLSFVQAGEMQVTAVIREN